MSTYRVYSIYNILKYYELWKGVYRSMFERQELISFCDYFEVPREFLSIAERFFSEEEIQFALAHKGEVFSADQVGEAFIREEYHKGFISKTEENHDEYRLNTFYGMLDVFVVSRKAEYDRKFTEEERFKMDEWYFGEYYQWLSSVQSSTPTEDKVLPLDEMLEFIDRQGDRPVYLNTCDCKSLNGKCGLPAKTCITYKDGINTFADRGLSERIDAKKAKEIVKAADKSGLMHTCNPNGICNCCDDCCYLFRGQKALGSYGVWPAAAYVAEMDEEVCIGCGLCVKRCRMQAFEKTDGQVKLNTEHCAGCGLCVNTCPKKALKLVDRKRSADAPAY